MKHVQLNRIYQACIAALILTLWAVLCRIGKISIDKPAVASLTGFFTVIAACAIIHIQLTTKRRK